MFKSHQPRSVPTRSHRAGRIVTIATSIAVAAAVCITAATALAANVVTPTASGPITSTGQCVTVAFTLTRDAATAARACEVRFDLVDLEPCAPNGLALGNWGNGFPGAGLTPFVSHGSGEFSAGQQIVGTPCGPTGDGVVFTINVRAPAGVTTSTGTITVVSASLLSCALGDLGATAGTPATVPINITAPGPVTTFTAVQVKTGNNPAPPPVTGSGTHINFQPATAPTPTDYVADTGATFNTTRGYGWFSTVIPIARNLLVNDPSDTFVKKANSSAPALWEIVLPNDDYRVRVGVGDALTQGTHIVRVEGTTFFDGVLTQGGRFESSIQTVTVADGRLTLSIGGAHATAPPLTETKINLIEIDPVVLKSGPGADDGIDVVTETTGITLSYTPPPTGTVEIYRAKFGGYPLYTGSVPTVPTYPPDPMIWTQVIAPTNPYVDRVPDRDFWYYTAFVITGGVASTGVRTDGTLNYHLGDVEDSNAGTECIGDDIITFLDVSKMGNHYATITGDVLFRACLDIAPTTNATSPIDGRPVPDGRINFTDLVYGGVNFLIVSKTFEVPAPARADDVSLRAPRAVRAGERIQAAVHARGAGRVQGMSLELSWDPAVVRPVGFAAGSFLETQGGIALSPRPGAVDVTLLGARSTGISGEGDLATVQFEALRDGDAALRLDRVAALDVALRDIEVRIVPDGEVAGNVPRATELLQNVPNPFNPTTKIAFVLADAGPVELTIYSVDGTKIRTLVRESRAAGRHEALWDGTDTNGHRVASGTYYARLAAPGFERALPISLVK